MVSRSYLAAHRPPLSPARLMFDQQVMPAAINAIGAVEVRLAEGAEVIRAWPLCSLAVGFVLGFIGARVIAAAIVADRDGRRPARRLGARSSIGRALKQ